jgi:ribose transport system substrate-binding protein
MGKKRIFEPKALAVALMALVLLATQVWASPKYSFAFVNPTMNNAFFVAIDGKLRDLAAKDGHKYSMVSSDWDNSLQLSQMEDIVATHPDLIFMTPDDPDGAKLGLQSAYNAKIPVIILDNPVNPKDRYLVKSTVASDNYQAGVVCAKMMLEDFPRGAILPILTHMRNAASVDRLNGFKDTIDKAKFKIVAQFDTGGTTDGAISPSEDILQAHQDITAWFCANEPSAIGAVTALKAAGKAGQIKVYCVDASPNGKKLIVDGVFAGEAAQQPLVIAQTSYDLALKLLAGQKIPEKVAVPCLPIRADVAAKTAGSWNQVP